jgi:hypothetical protein
MPRGRSRRENTDVFINCPFDGQYEPLFLALIAGLSGLGLTPRCVLGIPSGARDRLDRIFRLICQCGSSVHDLSCMSGRRGLPRFNMPFELGLAVAMSLSDTGHRWFLFEARPYRLQRTLSDVNGFDPYIHGGTPRGVLRELANAFITPGRETNVHDLESVYRRLVRLGKLLKRRDRVKLPFAARQFRDLVLAGQHLARESRLLPSRGR